MKNRLVLLTCVILLILFLTACTEIKVKIEEKNIIDLISEQPKNNTAYWCVISSDVYILRKDINELVEILSLENWENAGKISEEDTLRTIVINFNEFPEGKNEQNFDYKMGTVVRTQLVIETERQIAFNGYSTKKETYLLSSDIINALQNFIDEKAISHAELVEKMK